MKESTNLDYDKIIDIELKKKKLRDEFNMHTYGENGLPADVEESWLNYITKFEEQHKNAKKIDIFTYIGQPEFLAIETLSQDELKQELNSLLSLLKKHQILLDTLCDVEDEELYRFIVEELIKQEIDNMCVPGMMSCFTYEDFHPNNRYDIEHAFQHFIDVLRNKTKGRELHDFDLLYIDTSAFQSHRGISINQERVESRLKAFYNAFDTFKVEYLKITELQILDKEHYAVLDFKIAYLAFFDNDVQKINYTGAGRFKLKPSDYGGWDIFSIDMPGLLL